MRPRRWNTAPELLLPIFCDQSLTMEELFEIYTEDGKPNGLAARDIVHARGLWHRASNVFLFRPDGQLIVQRRHESKDICPGLWDLSVAEHLEPGESFLAGAIRGMSEELGITGVRLERVSNVVRATLDIAEQGIKDYEFQVSFRGEFDGAPAPKPSEVSEIRFLGLGELQAEMTKAPEKFTPWFRGRAVDIGLFDR